MIELIKQTWSNLTAHKLRSFLTMFGIIWGVISIMLLSAVSEGFQRGNVQVMREFGKNIIILFPGRTSMQAGGERAGKIIRLTIDDVHKLKSTSKLIESVTPELMRGGLSVKSPFNSASGQLSGIWPVFQSIRTVEVDRGRLINEQDCAEQRRVAVIGNEICKQLFADRDPTGQSISVNGIQYTIIGRIRKKEQDSSYTGPDNNRLFVPYETMRKDFPMPGENNSPDAISLIIAAPYQHVTDELIARVLSTGKLNNDITPVETEIRTLLSPLHNFEPTDREAIFMWNTAFDSAFFNKMISSMQEFFVLVSIITLALGGVGVMNIMLISVKERTKEIGVRRALGATSKNVLKQFFSEGIFITLISGSIGLIIGFGLCQAVNLLPLPPRFAGMIVTWDIALFAFGTMMIIGVAAALYPARKAAQMPPIEALRFEM